MKRIIVAIVFTLAYIPIIIIINNTSNSQNNQTTTIERTSMRSSSNTSGSKTGLNKHPINPDCVYWVPNGSVYHSWEGCSSLRNSITIYYGTIDEAIDEGKTRGCHQCCD